MRGTAILLDQWGALEGHPFYPTWKTRPGLSAAEIAALSPEFGARVRVRVAALRADMAHVETMPHVGGVHDWFAAAFPETWERWRAGLVAHGLDAADWLPPTRLREILGAETRAAFAAVADRVDPALWTAERDAFLRTPWSARSLLRMHLQRYADCRLQHTLPNPLDPATDGR